VLLTLRVLAELEVLVPVVLEKESKVLGGLHAKHVEVEELMVVPEEGELEVEDAAPVSRAWMLETPPSIWAPATILLFNIQAYPSTRFPAPPTPVPPRFAEFVISIVPWPEVRNWPEVIEVSEAEKLLEELLLDELVMLVPLSVSCARNHPIPNEAPT
jgi:hypothetical protein